MGVDAWRRARTDRIAPERDRSCFKGTEQARGPDFKVRAAQLFTYSVRRSPTAFHSASLLFGMAKRTASDIHSLCLSALAVYVDHVEQDEAVFAGTACRYLWEAYSRRNAFMMFHPGQTWARFLACVEMHPCCKWLCGGDGEVLKAFTGEHAEKVVAGCPSLCFSDSVFSWEAASVLSHRLRFLRVDARSVTAAHPPPRVPITTNLELVIDPGKCGHLWRILQFLPGVTTLRLEWEGVLSIEGVVDIVRWGSGVRSLVLEGTLEDESLSVGPLPGVRELTLRSSAQYRLSGGFCYAFSSLEVLQVLGTPCCLYRVPESVHTYRGYVLPTVLLTESVKTVETFVTSALDLVILGSFCSSLETLVVKNEAKTAMSLSSLRLLFGDLVDLTWHGGVLVLDGDIEHVTLGHTTEAFLFSNSVIPSIDLGECSFYVKDENPHVVRVATSGTIHRSCFESLPGMRTLTVRHCQFHENLDRLCEHRGFPAASHRLPANCVSGELVVSIGSSLSCSYREHMGLDDVEFVVDRSS